MHAIFSCLFCVDGAAHVIAFAAKLQRYVRQRRDPRALNAVSEREIISRLLRRRIFAVRGRETTITQNSDMQFSGYSRKRRFAGWVGGSKGMFPLPLTAKIRVGFDAAGKFMVDEKRTCLSVTLSYTAPVAFTSCSKCRKGIVVYFVSSMSTAVTAALSTTSFPSVILNRAMLLNSSRSERMGRTK